MGLTASEPPPGRLRRPPSPSGGIRPRGKRWTGPNDHRHRRRRPARAGDRTARGGDGSAGARPWFPWPEQGIKDVTLAAEAQRPHSKAPTSRCFRSPACRRPARCSRPPRPPPIVPDRAMLSGMRAPAHIILGWANDALKAHCQALVDHAARIRMGRRSDAAARAGDRRGHAQGHHREHRHHHPQVARLHRRPGHDRLSGDAHDDRARRLYACGRAQRGAARGGACGRRRGAHARRAGAAGAAARHHHLHRAGADRRPRRAGASCRRMRSSSISRRRPAASTARPPRSSG